MIRRDHRLRNAGIAALLPLCLLIVAGCSKPEDNAPPSRPTGAPTEGPGGAGGAPGGKMGGGGPGAALADNATGAEIYQAKCGCHGPGGKGGNAPTLTGAGSRTDEELFKIVHDGRKKMPAFGSQLKEEQIKTVVTTIKGFTP